MYICPHEAARIKDRTSHAQYAGVGYTAPAPRKPKPDPLADLATADFFDLLDAARAGHIGAQQELRRRGPSGGI